MARVLVLINMITVWRKLSAVNTTMSAAKPSQSPSSAQWMVK